MKAVIFPAPHQIAVETVPDPACEEEDVVVAVTSAGICGTDLHIFRGEFDAQFPLIPGHEFHGRVVETGSAVTTVRIGDHVVIDPNLYCGRCSRCRNQQHNQCLNLAAVGVTRDGGFAEFVSVPQNACYLLPDGMTDKQAAFVEPLACVVYALRRMHVNPADRVLILGAGPMGLLLVQALRHSGASLIVVTEKQPHRAQLAQSMGANAAIISGAEQEAHLRDLAPEGFDIVIDATGIPKVIENGFKQLKPRGTFLQFGVTPNDAQITLSPYDIFRKDWTILGSFALSYTFQPAIDWLHYGVINVEPLVSHTVPMEDFAEVFGMFGDGHTLKVHILITEQSAKA
jgi:2-desacetyl-2-hydroxyethyl bacteriochlorophyllide A dehydrogenase